MKWHSALRRKVEIQHKFVGNRHVFHLWSELCAHHKRSVGTFY